MNVLLAFVLLAVILYLLIQFGRQEYAQEYYDETIVDVEGRLDWARTRSIFPFGMRAQIDVCSQRLGEAKRYWAADRWHQACHSAFLSQEAIDKAQRIYSSAIKRERR